MPILASAKIELMSGFDCLIVRNACATCPFGNSVTFFFDAKGGAAFLERVDDNTIDTAGSQYLQIPGTVEKKAASPEFLATPVAVNCLYEHAQADLLRLDASEHAALCLPIV
nr:hypothetical protein [Rhizobium sp. AN69]